MNKTEAAQVLAIMAAPHSRDVGMDTAEVWYRSALAGTDLALGLEVAVRLVETEERFPTPARFNAERRSLAIRHRELERSDLLGIPGPPPDPAQQAQVVAGLRVLLSSRRQQKHFHGGPHPCPVCGGQVPHGWSTKADARRDAHNHDKCLTCFEAAKEPG